MAVNTNYKGRILVIDEMHNSLQELFNSIGWEIDYQPTIQREEILKIIGDYQGLILRSKIRVDAEVIEKAKKLRFVGRAGAGFDNIDDQLLSQKNIFLFTAGEGNRDAVAEHTIGMLLVLLNKLFVADQEVRSKIWNREANRGIELKGKTVGIIGYGNIGRALAERLLGFGCKILAYDKYKSGYGDVFAKQSSEQEIFEKADILSLHVPLTEQNRNYFDDHYFQQFAKPIFFINTARGELVKFSTIRNMLEQKKWLGAALDVLENEKLHTLTPEQLTHFEWIAKQKNVILTPHIAGWTVESYKKINEVLAEKVAKNL
ncbi:MAG: phosphoglycerate dehydrogenase [Cytophagales bacterium]|nr:phosphoglycerate dehydrogenase [Cytophagales bacterium]MDW8384191.1 NAD(P)-dependent oxidoreductase [Flammeovirgaceae bacterium]